MVIVVLAEVRQELRLLRLSVSEPRGALMLASSIFAYGFADQILSFYSVLNRHQLLVLPRVDASIASHSYSPSQYCIDRRQGLDQSSGRLLE
jgi:hypothetical protein